MPMPDLIRQNHKIIAFPGVVVVLTPVECTRYQFTPGRFRALVAAREAGLGLLTRISQLLRVREHRRVSHHKGIQF